jgi:hypothetical protein
MDSRWRPDTARTHRPTCLLLVELPSWRCKLTKHVGPLSVHLPVPLPHMHAPYPLRHSPTHLPKSGAPAAAAAEASTAQGTAPPTASLAACRVTWRECFLRRTRPLLAWLLRLLTKLCCIPPSIPALCYKTKCFACCCIDGVLRRGDGSQEQGLCGSTSTATKWLSGWCQAMSIQRLHRYINPT